MIDVRLPENAWYLIKIICSQCLWNDLPTTTSKCHLIGVYILASCPPPENIKHIFVGQQWVDQIGAPLICI